MPSEVFSHGWAQAQLHGLHAGPQFPFCGTGQEGRRAGPTRLKSSYPDPTQMWPWGTEVRRRQGDSRKQGWPNLFSQPCRVAYGHRQHLRQMHASPPAIKRGALWDVSKRLYPMDLPQAELLWPLPSTTCRTHPKGLHWPSPPLSHSHVPSLTQEEGVHMGWGSHPGERKGPYTQAKGSNPNTRARGCGGGSHERIGSEGTRCVHGRW